MQRSLGFDEEVVPRANTRTARKSPETTFHVFNRGIDRRAIFLDDADRREFLYCIWRYLRPGNCDGRGRPYKYLGRQILLISYCLMPNHFHLVLHQRDQFALTDLLQRSIAAYVRYLNDRHGRVGSLFGGEYRAKPITDHFQLKSTIAYVHANHPDGVDYKFSSHRYYAANGDDRPRWLDVETGLAAFGGQARYLEFLNEFVNADRQISY